MAPLSQPDFLTQLEAHLQTLHVPFSRAALQAFVEAAWPHISDDPDVAYFAGEFLAGETMAPA